MYFVEIVVLPAVLFSPKIKVATRKTVIYSTVTYISGNLDDSLTVFVKDLCL